MTRLTPYDQLDAADYEKKTMYYLLSSFQDKKGAFSICIRTLVHDGLGWSDFVVRRKNDGVWEDLEEHDKLKDAIESFNDLVKRSIEHDEF